MITTERSVQNSAYGRLGSSTGRRPPASRWRASPFAAAALPSRWPWGWSAPPWVTWLVPAAAALLLYARTLGYAFVWDDMDLVVRNAALQGADWARLLAQDFWRSTGGGTGMWRPWVTLSYRIDGALSGWQPWSFHLVNVLAHAASSALVAILARGRGVPAWAALGAGLVYATAPALSESTAWIAGRTDAFAALATLAALLCARAWRERATFGAAAAMVACTTLALLAKESALVLPALLAADALDVRARGGGSGRGGGNARRDLVPALASLAVVVLWAIAHRTLVAAPSRPADPGALAGVAALVWAHLAWLAPWAPHSPLLDLWRAPSTAVAALAWIAGALVLVGAVLAHRRRFPLLLPIALLFAPLVPVAGASLVEAGVRFAERSLTLPVAGLALAIAELARAPGLVARAAPAVMALWLVLQSVAAWPAIGAWRDEESRIRRIAQVRPQDADAQLGLADLLSTLGREGEAREWIARAEAADPRGAAPLVARASLEFRGGRAAESLAAAEQALARAPDDLAAGMIRVRALVQLARAEEALVAARELEARHAGAPAALGALGVARLANGDAAGAIPPLSEASAHLLDDAGLAWDLGRAAIAVQDVALAREAFERAVVAAPAFYEAWLGVADTRARTGDRAGAEQALVRAAALPGASDGRVELLRARIER